AALTPIVGRDGVEAAIRRYHELKATQADAYDFSEGELNQLGYVLLQGKKVKDAIEILKVNVQAYPASGDVYDSLGEAYAAAGERDLAIASYRKSLEIDPANLNAVEQ